MQYNRRPSDPPHLNPVEFAREHQAEALATKNISAELSLLIPSKHLLRLNDRTQFIYVTQLDVSSVFKQY